MIIAVKSNSALYFYCVLSFFRLESIHPSSISISLASNREETTVVSPAKPRFKPRISQLLSTMAALGSSTEDFASELDFRRYTELFHGCELVAGRRFNLSCLTTIGLQFEAKLVQCEIRSLAVMDQDVYPE